METMRQRLREALRIYVITGSRLSLGRDNVEVVRQAIAGGARIIQLREKEAAVRELVAMGQAMLDVCRGAGVLFLINDRVDVAQAIGADGVHVGQEDLPAGMARRLLGPGKVIGVSVETAAEARAAENEGADYVSTGPTFPTLTKPDAGDAYGTGIIAVIKSAVRLPVVAIGGISADNISEVARAGADGAAVISAVVAQPDIAEAVRELNRRFSL